MIPRVSKHSVIATPVGGQAFDISVRGHSVRTDQPVGSGGADTAPTPLEMMSISLAGCIALYVRRFCDREAQRGALSRTPPAPRRPRQRRIQRCEEKSRQRARTAPDPRALLRRRL